MPTLLNTLLTLSPEYSLKRATLTAQCDVRFAQFEVDAMNRLGLRYVLSCRVINKDLWYETVSAEFGDVQLPRADAPASAVEHVEFQMIAPVDDLQQHVFTRDEFFAELTLRDAETGVEQVARTGLVRVDLAA